MAEPYEHLFRQRQIWPKALTLAEIRQLRPGEIPFARLSEIALDGGLKLVRRETVEGSLAFLYENKYHPGGVSIRNTTDDIWIGANDHRILKAEMLFTEAPPFTKAWAVTRYTVTCSYGPVPERKAPFFSRHSLVLFKARKV